MSNSLLQPWQLFLVTLAGIVNREQQRAIECRRTEGRTVLIYWGGYRTWEDLPVPGMLRYQIERSHDPTGVPARRRNGLTRGEIASSC